MTRDSIAPDRIMKLAKRENGNCFRLVSLLPTPLSLFVP